MGKYQLNKNPTTSIECKVYKALFKYENGLSDQERFKPVPNYSKSSHIYGLPKVDKIHVPLRPIVSSRDGPVYDLSINNYYST